MKQDGFHEYVMQDVLAGIPNIRSRRMFGGFGIYKEDLMIGLIANGVLYFKADAKTIPDFEAHESQPFAYDAKDRKKVTLSYWAVPESIMNHREEIERWTQAAFEAAQRSKAGTKSPRRVRS